MGGMLVVGIAVVWGMVTTMYCCAGHSRGWGAERAVPVAT